MEMMGATGLDREEGMGKACRVSTYPRISGTKEKGRLRRARLGCLMQPRHLDLPPASDPEWREPSGIALCPALGIGRNLKGFGVREPVSGRSFAEIEYTD